MAMERGERATGELALVLHAHPLAEYCLLSMLTFTKRFSHVQREQRQKHWERYAATDLENRTLGIVGVGAVGRDR